MSGVKEPINILALDPIPTLGLTGFFPVSLPGKTWRASIEQLVVLAGGLQTISYNPTTGALTISGANTVTIPLGPKKWVSEVTEIGGGIPVTFTHNLNTRNILVDVWDADTNSKILGPVEADTPNTIKITASVTFNARVVIIG